MSDEHERESDLTISSLENALSNAESRLEDARKDLEVAQVEVRGAAEEVELLQRLLALRSGDHLPSSDRLPTAREQSAVKQGGRAPHEVVEASILLLREAGHPLHISELMRQLTERGVHLPGAGAQANVISHISRDERIARPSRGIYGLKEWNMALPSAARQRTHDVGSDGPGAATNRGRGKQ